MYKNHNGLFNGLSGMKNGLNQGLLAGLHGNNHAKSIDSLGGTISYITDYRLHIFNATDFFDISSCQEDAEIWILVVGGGAGGASVTSTNAMGGGAGGGGGVVEIFKLKVKPGRYTCTIGAGGGVTLDGNGSQGNNSVFIFPTGERITAFGGGHGRRSDLVGGDGPTGGGSRGFTTQTTGGRCTIGNQGFPASGAAVNSLNGGGGGGAGGFGGVGLAAGSGNGGVGYLSYITGVGVRYAGGGGGGSGNILSTIGTGTDGGGNGSRDAAATAGTPNTGGGGGASGRVIIGGAAGIGGSGKIIIAVPQF